MLVERSLGDLPDCFSATEAIFGVAFAASLSSFNCPRFKVFVSWITVVADVDLRPLFLGEGLRGSSGSLSDAFDILRLLRGVGTASRVVLCITDVAEVDFRPLFFGEGMIDSVTSGFNSGCSDSLSDCFDILRLLRGAEAESRIVLCITDVAEVDFRPLFLGDGVTSGFTSGCSGSLSDAFDILRLLRGAEAESRVVL